MNFITSIILYSNALFTIKADDHQHSSKVSIKGDNVELDLVFTEHNETVIDGKNLTIVNISGNYTKSNDLKNVDLPFHIHEFKVMDNNCTTTKGHYDPFKVNTNPATYKCDPSKPLETCEVGDLAGKIHKLNGETGTINYNDTTIGPLHNIANRSVVVHNSDGSRIACADIVDFVNLTPNNNNTDNVKSDSSKLSINALWMMGITIMSSTIIL